MIQAIKDYCKKTDQQVPQTVGELFACIYHSLAKSYGDTVKEIEEISDSNHPVIHIVGGGAKDSYLDSLTATPAKKLWPAQLKQPRWATCLLNCFNGRHPYRKMQLLTPSHNRLQAPQPGQRPRLWHPRCSIRSSHPTSSMLCGLSLLSCRS
jgi:hypothetical protein